MVDDLPLGRSSLSIRILHELGLALFCHLFLEAKELLLRGSFLLQESPLSARLAGLSSFLFQSFIDNFFWRFSFIVYLNVDIWAHQLIHILLEIEAIVENLVSLFLPLDLALLHGLAERRKLLVQSPLREKVVLS